MIDPFADIQAATRAHRKKHGCGAYTFENGPELLQLAAALQPKRVLELGTALGYTACCLAQGSPRAQVDTVEMDEDHVALAREQIAKHGLSDRICVHPGAFEQVLPVLVPGFDLIFFDGFAPTPGVIRRLRELLMQGGVLVCSNLQLAKAIDAHALGIDLDDPDRWQAMPALEGGRTRVCRKHAPDQRTP